MKPRDFKKLTKDKTPNEILSMYMKNEIFLYKFQIDYLIKLKKGTNEENRGGISFGRTNNIWFTLS